MSDEGSGVAALTADSAARPRRKKASPARTIQAAHAAARALWGDGRPGAAADQLAPFCSADCDTPLLVTYARLLLSANRLQDVDPVIEWLAAGPAGRVQVPLLRAQRAVLAGALDDAIAVLEAPALNGVPEAKRLRWALTGDFDHSPDPNEPSSAVDFGTRAEGRPVALSPAGHRSASAAPHPPFAASPADCLAAAMACLRAGKPSLADGMLDRAADSQALAAQAGYWRAVVALAEGRAEDAAAGLAGVESALKPAQRRPLQAALRAVEFYRVALAAAREERWDAALKALDSAVRSGTPEDRLLPLRTALRLRAGLAEWHAAHPQAIRHLEAAAGEDSWSRQALMLLSEPFERHSAPDLPAGAAPWDVLQWLKTRAAGWESLPAAAALAELDSLVDAHAPPAALRWGVVLAFKARDEAAQRAWSQRLLALPGITRAARQQVSFLQLCLSLRAGRLVPRDALLAAAPADGLAAGLALVALAFRAYLAGENEIAAQASQSAAARLKHVASTLVPVPLLLTELRNLDIGLAMRREDRRAVRAGLTFPADSPAALQNLAMLAEIRDEDPVPLWEQAIALWKRAGKSPAFFVKVRQRLVLLCLQAERWDDLAHQCEELLRLEPDDVSILVMMATVLTAAKKYSEVLSIANRLVRLQPDEVEYRILVAEVTLEKEGLLAAINYLRTLSEQFRITPEYQDFCGTVLNAADERLKALFDARQWEMAQELCRRARDICFIDGLGGYFEIRESMAELQGPTSDEKALDRARAVLSRLRSLQRNSMLQSLATELKALIERKEWSLARENLLSQLHALWAAANKHIQRPKNGRSEAQRRPASKVLAAILAKAEGLDQEIKQASKTATRAKAAAEHRELQGLVNEFKSNLRAILEEE